MGCSGSIPSWGPQPEDPRSAYQGTASVYRALHGVLKPYGPWLTTLHNNDRVALVVSDTEDQPAKFLHTGAFAYVRLRGTGYDENALEGWGASFRSTLEDGVDVFAYLKHEDRATGPRDAAILKRIAGT